MEEWRDIPSAPAYQASNAGRIRRIRPSTGTKPGRVRRLHARASGYLDVTLSHGDVQCNRTVHSLVCEAFHGPKPSKNHDASHRNGKRFDNRADNITWKLHVDNEADKIAHGTLPRGQSHYRSLLTEAIVREIRARARQGEKAALIAKDLSLQVKHVCKIIKCQIWAHVQ